MIKMLASMQTNFCWTAVARAVSAALIFGCSGCAEPNDDQSTFVKNDANASKGSTINMRNPIAASVATKKSIIAGRAFGEFKVSELKPDVKIYFAYDQPLGSVYSSSWWVGLDSKNGDWRDVYYETNEKLTNSGIISFRCDGQGDIGVFNYGAEWGNADTKTVYTVKLDDRHRWKTESQNESWADDLPPLPYQVFNAAHKKFC